jgi:protein TonB
MNIQKYILPASVAATVHVALLWFLPEESYVRIIEVPLANKISNTEPVPQPPAEPEDTDLSTAEVKPLLGAPAPISLEEPAVRPVETAFPMPMDDSRPSVNIGTLVPPVIGEAGGDREGTLRPDTSIFNVRMLDHAPHGKVQMPPDYPYSMKQAGLSGSVLVEFDVDKHGQVTRAEALSYSDRDFVEPALRAVRKWRFEPGRRDGKAVPFRMTIPIEFSLENAP